MTGGDQVAAAAALKISVVVPVYNPGGYLEVLVTSLQRQSMPSTDFEVVFVDDGSTDGTGERLDRLAAEVANVTVIHIPNSGWPGKPRNVGLDAAAGEYVYFVDNDDALGDEALERMHRYATEHHSDVVIGKEVRRNVRRHVPAMFTENRPHARLGVDPLLTYLTPHKMFRRAFLLEHDLRFPEGRRRLEDHPFVIKAYFVAEVISVLSDYPCYYWINRLDRSNAAARAIDWPAYYGNLRDALDVVAEHTAPGDLRDELLAHWYRLKGLAKLGPSLARRPPAEAAVLFTALRELALERFPPSVDAHLRPAHRVLSQLLRDNRFDRILDLAAQGELRLEQRIDSLSWRGGVLEARVRARLVYADGSPVLLDGPAADARWSPPVPLDDVVAGERLSFGPPPADPVRVAVRHRQRFDAYLLPGSTQALPPDAQGRRSVGAVTTVRLDASVAAQGSPLPSGVWELDVQLSAYGWARRAMLRLGEVALPPVSTSGGRVVGLFVDKRGSLVVSIGSVPRALLARTRPAVGAARLHTHLGLSDIEVPLDGLSVDGPPLAAELVVGADPSATARFSATLVPRRPGGVTLRAVLPGRQALRALLRSQKNRELRLRLGKRELPLDLELALRGGQPVLRPVGEPPAIDRAWATTGRAARVASRRARRAGGLVRAAVRAAARQR